MGMMEDLLHEGLDVVEIDGNISDNVLKRNIADVKYYVDSDFTYADGQSEDTVMGDESTLPHPPHLIEKDIGTRSEEHTSELQSRGHLVCRLLLEKKKQTK